MLSFLHANLCRVFSGNVTCDSEFENCDDIRESAELEGDIWKKYNDDLGLDFFLNLGANDQLWTLSSWRAWWLEDHQTWRGACPIVGSHSSNSLVKIWDWNLSKNSWRY